MNGALAVLPKEATIMPDSDKPETPRMSNVCCPSCGCRQTQDAVDDLTYVNSISGMDCTTCGEYFVVGEPVFVGFGGH